MRVAFFDQCFRRREWDDFESGARRCPGWAEGRPAGTVGLVFVAQRGDRGGAAVPELRRFPKCLRAAIADQGAADSRQELPDSWKIFRRERER